MNANTILKIGLGLSIVVILNALFLYGIQLAFGEPQYEKFCRPELNQIINDQKTCEEKGGIWQNYPAIKNIPEAQPVTTSSYCDMFTKCNKEFQDAQNQFNQKSFFVLIILGLGCALLGYLVIKPWPIAFGFSFGGLFAFFIGVIKNWSNLQEYSRFLILLLALGVLIYIGYKKFRDN